MADATELLWLRAKHKQIIRLYIGAATVSALAPIRPGPLLGVAFALFVSGFCMWRTFAHAQTVIEKMAAGQKDASWLTPVRWCKAGELWVFLTWGAILGDFFIALVKHIKGG